MAPDPTRFEEQERLRREATSAIVNSAAEKKLVVAGPGTGKTHAFKETLRVCGGRGLALTFIRNLVVDLEQALSDLAAVFTFHGFCKHQLHRHSVAGLQNRWDYYPPLLALAECDIPLLGRPAVTKEEIESRLHNLDLADGVIDEVLALGSYYNAVSHTDLVYRALRHFESNENEIPTYPLIVVDEYQDFSRLETEFIRLLSTKSDVLIAGDDDQALYGFKNASPEYIRELAKDEEFKRFKLPFCSRCTLVIVDAVSDVISAAVKNGNLADRLEKEFRCYLADKLMDSEAHPKIIHAKCTVECANAPYIGRYIAERIARIPIDDIRESREKDYPTALVIGPKPFLGRAYATIVESYPQARLRTAPQLSIEPLDGYRRIARDAGSRLGWRILGHCCPFDGADDAVREALANQADLALPAVYRDHHLTIAELVRRLLDEEQLRGEEEAVLTVAIDKSLAEIKDALEIVESADPPEGNEGQGKTVEEAEPTIVCTSLVGAKGLSAGYVYIVGFNDGHFPRDRNAITDEEVCCFLVGLSRTRKQCHLVSCGRLGNERLRVSAFANWIGKHMQTVTIDAAYFRARGRRKLPES